MHTYMNMLVPKRIYIIDFILSCSENVIFFMSQAMPFSREEYYETYFMYQT